MKYLKHIPILSLVLSLIVVSVVAQTETFTNPNVDYSFEIPDAKWKITAKPTATTANVEMVFGERNDGHLEVRKLTVASTAILADIVRDEETKLQFQPGYVAGKEENFGGFHKGVAFNYEFVRSGRPMSGRFYFLRPNPTTVYVLRFTGFSDKLRSIRNQTDSIARTFKVA